MRCGAVRFAGGAPGSPGAGVIFKMAAGAGGAVSCRGSCTAGLRELALQV